MCPQCAPGSPIRLVRRLIRASLIGCRPTAFTVAFDRVHSDERMIYEKGKPHCEV